MGYSGWDRVGRPNAAPNGNRIIRIMVSLRQRGVADTMTVDGAGIQDRNSVEMSNNANVRSLFVVDCLVLRRFVKDTDYSAANVFPMNKSLGTSHHNIVSSCGGRSRKWKRFPCTIEHVAQEKSLRTEQCRYCVSRHEESLLAGEYTIWVT